MAQPGDPIARFQAAFERARDKEAVDATASALATADAAGRPSVRMVLLKEVDENGFVFYTNRESRKGREMAENPHAALCFYWPSIDLQVRIEGAVEPVSDEESDAYFASRPRGSQIGAWTSQQSRPLASRRELVTRYLETQARFAGKSVERPPSWGGYLLRPERIEFWHNQLHRLHDRIEYRRAGAGWVHQRLYP